jgi:hypothetical protein
VSHLILLWLLVLTEVHIAWYDYTDYDGSGSDRDIFYKKGEKKDVFLVVRGSDNRIYYHAYSGVWENWKAVPSGTTCDTPAAVVWNGNLYLVVRSMDGNSLYFGSINLGDDRFSGWRWISGSTHSQPTLARWGSTLILAVRGTNNRVYFRYYSTATDIWYDWKVFPTRTTVDSPTAAVDGDYLILLCGE